MSLESCKISLFPFLMGTTYLLQIPSSPDSLGCPAMWGDWFGRHNIKQPLFVFTVMGWVFHSDFDVNMCRENFELTQMNLRFSSDIWRNLCYGRGKWIGLLNVFAFLTKIISSSLRTRVLPSVSWSGKACFWALIAFMISHILCC